MKIQVSPSGPLSAKIAFIGGFPDETDVAKREPFTGKSGNLLRALMTNAGIIPSQCYMTYVVKQKPKTKTGSEFFKVSKKGEVVTSEEYDEAETLLLAELAHSDAHVFVAVGRVALYALTRLHHANKYRNSILGAGDFTKPIGGRKVIPILDPQSCFATYENRLLISHDLHRIVEEAEYPELRLPERKIIIRPSFEQCIDYLRDMPPVIGADIEVSREEMSCIAIAKSPIDVLVIPFWSEKGNYFTPEHEVQVYELLARVLEDDAIKKVWHNAAFDCPFLFRKYGLATNNAACSMVAQGIAYPDFPKSLGFVASMYTREPYFKDEGKDCFRGYIRDFEQYWRYCGKDAATCLESYEQILPILDKQGNTPTFQQTTDVLPPLFYMMERGILVDKDGMVRVAAELEEEITQCQQELNEMVVRKTDGLFTELNPNSSKQCKAYFYGHLEQPAYTKKGSVSTDIDAMKRLKAKGFPEAGKVLEIRKKRKLVGTYFEMAMDGDGRIRSSYNPVGTPTGRWSSRSTIFGTGCNMQNLTYSFKKYVLPDPDYLMFDIDLSQAELITLANCGPITSMLEAMADGKDMHKLTASRLFDIPYDEVSDEKGSSEFGDGSKSQRFWGKCCNHSLNYGLGPGNFAIRYEITLKEAKRLIALYHASYPEVQQRYQHMIRDMLNTNRTVTTPWGRTRRFAGRWPSDTLAREAYNHFAQSTVADTMNRVIVYIYRTYGPEVQLLNQVHDSVVLQIRKDLGYDRIVEILTDVCQRLEEPIPWKNPFIIPAEAAFCRTYGEQLGLGRPTVDVGLVERLQKLVEGEG